MATPAAPKKTSAHGAGGMTPCLGGGGVLPRQKLLRFVAGPDGKIYLDLNHDLPGMGAYVRPGLSFFKKALSTKALQNALGANYEGTAEDLQAMALAFVEKQLTSRLGLLRKAGHIITGADMVMEAGYNDKLQSILVAEDIAQNTLKKVTHAAENVELPLFTVCRRDLLEQALGKGNCTVVGLHKRANVNEFRRLLQLWQGLKGLNGAA